MGNSLIEWTESTWNPITGCSPVSEGCKHCYAKRMAKRLAANPKVKHKERYEDFKPAYWAERVDEPLKWKKARKVFVCSMGDLFHEDVPFEYIQRIWATMQAPACHKHTFQILTKRPERMREYYEWNKACPANGRMGVEFERPHIWLGVTAENQKMADKRIPELLKIPAAKRFVSVEPMLGAINVELWLRGIGCQRAPGCPGNCKLCRASGPLLDWVICGGETGPGARPMHPDWARGLRDQCQEAGVPFFFKQWGEWTANIDICLDNILEKEDVWMLPEGVSKKNEQANYDDPETIVMVKVGKKKAGRMLDGREWNELPGKEN